MPWALFLRLLVLAVAACRAVHATRQCARCTFMEEDNSLLNCSLCDAKLPGASSSVSAQQTIVDQHVCHWPLSNGSICPYHSRDSSNMARHRQCRDHSNHRQNLDAAESTAAEKDTGLRGLFKRQRADNSKINVESQSDTSSTRAKTPAEHGTSTRLDLDSFVYRPPAPAESPSPPPQPKEKGESIYLISLIFSISNLSPCTNLYVKNQLKTTYFENLALRGSPGFGHRSQ